MSRICFYYHGGSLNHGCEAIVRSTSKILDARPMLFSYAPHEDFRYQLQQVVEVIDDSYIPVKTGTPSYFFCAIDHKLHHNDYQFIRHGHATLLQALHPGDLCLSIGGDNYCYNGTDILGYYNRMLHKKGCRTVLWGCSIEPSALNPEVVADLKLYDLITVRESLSLEGLRQAGITDNVLLCSDPAFQLDASDCPLPEGFTSENTIGINLSPLAAQCGNLVVENYIDLLHHLFDNTSYRVLLVPHVIKPESDDRKPLRKLYSAFQSTGRIALLDDHNCIELKGAISQCRMFIGARTHATIAAYSTCVPTLVAGYSIKANGIAQDIFGTDDHYVVPVQHFTDRKCLKNAFLWLSEHEEEIRTHLQKVMPIYNQRALLAGDAVKRMMKK